MTINGLSWFQNKDDDEILISTLVEFVVKVIVELERNRYKNKRMKYK